MRKVDVAIIGAGTSGLSARREVAAVTDNYVVIDPGPFGTTCARVGCMPSKALIQIANDYHRRHVFKEFGVSGCEGLSIDTDHVMSYMRNMRDYFVSFVKKAMQEWEANHLIQDKAYFIDDHTLQAGDQQIQADKIIIATGSKPILPKPWEAYKKHLIDTDEFFELETLPKKVAVIGLGVIGLELGQALSRLGIDVVGLTLGKQIAGLSDPDLQNYAAKTVCQELPTSFEGAEIVRETEKGLLLKSGEKEYEVEKAFLTMGRKPALDFLKLENTSIELNERGVPLYDQTTMQISNTGIFLAGDANADRSLLHEAADEGRIAGYNAVNEDKQCFQRREFLAITFSDPNIAVLGQSFSQLQESKVDFVVGKVSFENQGRATLKKKNKGLVHLYADRHTGKFLGAEMIGPSVEHMAHMLSWITTLNLTVHQVLSLPFYHPVLEEGLRTAFRDLANQIEIEPGKLELLRCQEPPVEVG